MLGCACHNIDKLAYKTLQNAGISDYLSFPLIQDKNKALEWLKTLPDNLKATQYYKDLEAHIAEANSFICIVGYDATNLRWAEVGKSDVAQQILGEEIARVFANR